MHDKTQRGLEQLRSEIFSNRYKYGENFPSEYALMSRLHLGHGAVRAILDELRKEQLISDTTRGKCSKCLYSNTAHEDKSRLLFLTYDEMIFYNDDIYDARYYGIKRRCEELEYHLDNFYYGKMNDVDLVDYVRSNNYAGVIRLINDWGRSGGGGRIDKARRHYIELLSDAGIPCVIAGSEIGQNLPCSCLDFREIGRMAGRWLLAHNCRNLMTLTGEMISWMYAEMLAGFRGVLAEENIYLSKEQVISFPKKVLVDLNVIPYTNILDSIKKVRPDGIFTMRDYRASIVYAYALSEKINLPDDLSIISFDNHTWDATEAVGLTSINEPLMQLGMEAVDFLHEWITNGDRPKNKILQSNIVER